VSVETHSEVVSEVARLRFLIDRAAAATESTLARHPPASEDDDPRSPRAEHQELCRQLAALRERVALAEYVNEGPRALRGELATLLFFAETLQDDAVGWRSTLEERIKELERRSAAARRERDRLAAEREKLVRRRDALRLGVHRAAARLAEQGGGGCRNTVPVFTLAEGLTVCSVSVSWPRKGLQLAKHWLVTLNDSRDDVTVVRTS